MKRVPHCKDCNNCKQVQTIYISYYCYHDDSEKYISVDNYPKTSPGWCPLRNDRNYMDDLLKKYGRNK